MSTDDDRLSEREAKRILEIAFSTKRDAGRLSLDDLAQSAVELGVSKEKIAEAHKLMRAEQVRSRATRKRVLVGALAAVVMASGVVFIQRGSERARIAEEARVKREAAEANQPHPFKGQVVAHWTSEVKSAASTDTLTRVRVLETRTITLFTSYSGLTHKHRTRCELRGPDGALVDEQVLQMTAIAEPYAVWYTFPVSWNWQPGTYVAHVFADDVQVAERALDVELGVTKIVTAANVVDNSATDVRATFKQGKDETAYAHVHFDYLKGQGGRLRWTWYQPDGTAYETESLVLADPAQNGVWNAWDGLMLKDVPAGKWRVVVTLEDSALGDAFLTVE